MGGGSRAGVIKTRSQKQYGYFSIRRQSVKRKEVLWTIPMISAQKISPDSTHLSEASHYFVLLHAIGFVRTVVVILRIAHRMATGIAKPGSEAAKTDMAATL
jgi:hypothetical protein